MRPPVRRLERFATLFATRRSLDDRSLRVLALEKLTDEERGTRNDLLDELLLLRGGIEPAAARSAPNNLWTFPQDHDIIIVCAPLPRELRANLPCADTRAPTSCRSTPTRIRTL